MDDLFGNGGIDFTDSNKPVENEKVLVKVVAIFDFEAQEPTDLGFRKGEEIEVLKKEGDWWSGRIGSRVGTFPFNYVKVPEKMDDSDPLAQVKTYYINNYESSRMTH